MPRSGRGGARTGKMGTPYANRTDMHQNYTGQAYGQASAQAASQKVLPVQAPAGPPPMDPSQVQPFMPPGAHGDFHRPTETSNPVTHGLPVGPGAGPEVLGAGSEDPALTQLRALYLVHPSDDLRSLIEEMTGG